MPGTGQRAVTRARALPALVVYAVALIAIPSELVVQPLGAAGTPAQVIGVVLFLWWAVNKIGARPAHRSGSNPVKWLLLLFAVALVLSYLAGMTRPVISALEVNSADRALLSLCSWCGVALVVADGLLDRRELDVLLRVVAGGVAGIAALGMIQFFFGLDIAHLFHIPGLTPNGAVAETVERSDFRRVTGTTAHPIEFGVVLSSALPLVIHYARFSERRTHRGWWWFATVLVAAALPMSVARSATLGGIIAVLYLFHTWPPRLKVRALLGGGVGIAAMTVLVPGLLGTIRGLVFNASSDPSTQGRTADYAPAWHYVVQRPFFGRGFGTFIPSEYRTLDNQYLGVLIEAGFVGLLCMLALFLGTACVAGSIRRHVRDEPTRDLAQCLKAGVVIIAVNAATFDAFGFAMCVGLCFVYIGAVASLRSLESARYPVRAARDPRRRIAVATACLALGWVACVTAWRQAPPTYVAYTQLLLQPGKPSPTETVFDESARSDLAASVLHDVMDSGPVRAQVAGHGATDYTVAVGDGSLMSGTDVDGYGPSLAFETSARSAASADSAMRAVLSDTSARFAGLQRDVAVGPKSLIRLAVVSDQPAIRIPGRPGRAEGALALLLIIALSVAVRLRAGTGGTAPDAVVRAHPLPRRGVVDVPAH